MKDRKFAAFYRKYLTVLIIILVLGLIAVWVGLKIIQKNYVSEENEEVWVKSQKAFETEVSQISVNDWADLWMEKHPDTFDDYDTVLSVMKEQFGGNVNYARSRDYSDDAPVYVIENDEHSLAEISLEQNAESDWVIKEIGFRLEGDKEATVVAPSGCTVTCNGRLLDETYISSDESDEEKLPEKYFFMDEYAGDLKNAVELHRWTVKGQLSEPVLSVTAPEGMELSEDKRGMPILIQSPADEELCKKADGFFDAYNKYGLYGYLDKEVNMKTAASLTKKDSQAYTLIYESLEAIKLAPCHSVYETKKTMGPVIIWADNAVSIDIAYETETTYRADEKDHFDGEYRILMIDFGEGEGFEICGFENA